MAIGTPLKNTPTYWSSGSGTVPWPAGAAAGQFMVAFIAGDSSGDDKREPVDAVADGWTVWNKTYSTHTWWRILDAAYLAAHPSGIAFRGRIVFLTLIPGVGAAGARTSSAGATLSKPNAAVMMFGRGRSSLQPTAGKQFSDVQNPAYGNRRNNVWFRTETTTGYKSFAGFNGTDADGFELIPLEGPNPPILVAPIGSDAVDFAAATTLEVVHQSRQAATQEKLKERVRPVAVPAGAWSYVLANGTLSAVETSVDTAAPGLSIAAGQLSAGEYEWSAATFDNGLWSDWAPSETFTATTRPTVVVTLTTGAGNLSPTVSWTRSVIGSQVAYQVRIARASGGSWTNFVHDSGVVAGGASSYEVPASGDWVNGGSYVARVQITQSDQLKSNPTGSTAQTVSWTPPATASGCAYAPGSPPTIVASGIEGDTAVFEASDDGGTTWRRVAEVEVPSSSRVNLVPNPTLDDLTGWNAPQGGTAAFYDEANYQGKFHTVGQAQGGFVAVAASGSASTVGLSIPRIAVPGGVTKVTIGAWAEADAPLEFQIQANLLTSGVPVYPKSSAVDMTDSTYSGVRHVWTFGLPAGTTECGLSLFARNPGLVGNVEAGKRLWLDNVTMEWGVTDGSWLQTLSVEDPLAPYGVSALPRVRVQKTVDGVAMWSAYRTGPGFVSADLGGYFVADGSWLRVETAGDSDVEPIEDRVVSTGLGAEFASVDRGPRQGFRGAAAFTTLTYADELALVAWLDDRDAWTWRRPPESDGYTRVNRAPTLITAAAWKVARHVSRGAWSPRVFSIDWVEQG